jgi:Holliday junction resolvasome RuvABC endonuclease subunit
MNQFSTQSVKNNHSSESCWEIILSLDLGTKTGWALQGGGGLISSGTVNFKNDRWQGGGMRFLKFTRFLDELRSNAGPIAQVYFEEVRRHLGVDAAHAYGGFLAHLTAWCEQKNIPYQGVPVGTIKKHATGKGNANKAMMIASVKQRGHQPADDNEADAIALLYWALENQAGGA